MAVWRVYGQVMAKRRSGHGLHLVLFARRIEFAGFQRRNLAFLPLLCPTGALSASLDSQLRLRDLVHVAGVTEPRTRPQSPILTRDWEMIITEACIPSLSNLCRRLWTLPPPRYSAHAGDDPQS